MIDKKTLNSLDSMTKFKTYSKYNNILDKRFKGYSLKSLIKTSRNPRQFVKAKFLEELARKFPYENDQIININNLNKKQRDFFEAIKEKKMPPKIEINPWSRKSSYTKIFEVETDPFHYNPNYNSIFKNIPCCIISPLRKKNIKNINKKQKMKNFKTPIILNKKFKTENNTIYKNNKHKIMDNLTIESDNNKKNSNTLKNIEKFSQTLTYVKSKRKFLDYMNKTNDKNNHAFKFSNYTPRKNKVSEQSDIVSYIEPYNYKKNNKKTVDFGKMQDRAKSMLVNYANLEIPSLNYYNPKYEYTQPKTTQILFTHDDIIEENKKSNKFLIHKLWTSYSYQTRYELVDNDKLNK